MHNQEHNQEQLALFDQLCMDHEAGTLSPDAAEQLAQMLKQSASLRARFHEYRTVSALLTSTAANAAVSTPKIASRNRSKTRSSRKKTTAFPRYAQMGVAAAAVFCFIGAWLYFQSNQSNKLVDNRPFISHMSSETKAHIEYHNQKNMHTSQGTALQAGAHLIVQDGSAVTLKFLEEDSTLLCLSTFQPQQYRCNDASFHFKPWTHFSTGGNTS